MLSVLVALWLLFGVNQGAECCPAPYHVELSGRAKCSASTEIGDELSKPKEIKVSWGTLKRIYRGKG